VSTHKKQIHRKDAKNAKETFNENDKKLCVLCVFAVKRLFIDEYKLDIMY